jgi:subtilase family protein
MKNIMTLSSAVSFFIALTVPVAFLQDAVALDNSKKPQGANHAKAHAKATGSGIPLGIIDVDAVAPAAVGGIKAANNLGARLQGQFDFRGIGPGAAPVDFTAAGGNDDHATLTADVAAGGVFGNYVGVAKNAKVFMGDTGGTTPAARYDSFRGATSWLQKNKGVQLFNASIGLGNNDNGANNPALYTDWFMRQYDALIVKSAGNNGAGFGDGSSQITAPGDFFNGITVGASDANFQARANYSSYWLQRDNGTAPDIRGKPDILAPGTAIGDGKSYPNALGVAQDQDGTSFAAPHVTGVAAMLMERGLDLPGPAMRNHQEIKAIILNSARKRGINPPENGVMIALDNTATADEASDANYLLPLGFRPVNIPVGKLRAGGTATSPKTNLWTPTEWTSDGANLTVTKPLDDEQGTGMLDAQRAMIQFDGGEQEEKPENPGGITPIGWNRDDVVAGDSDLYEFNFTIPKGTFITATLVWDRIVIEKDLGVVFCLPNTPGLPATCGQVDATDTYESPFLPDFDLHILYKGGIVASSESGDESVEHLHYPVPAHGDPFDYALEIVLHGALPTLRDYGLAWWTATPEPGTWLLLLVGAFGFALARGRRLYRLA